MKRILELLNRADGVCVNCYGYTDIYWFRPRTWLNRCTCYKEVPQR